MLACSGLRPGRFRPPRAYADRLRPPLPARRWRVAASAAAPGGSPDLPSSSSNSNPLSFGAGDDQAAAAAAASSSSGFCIIEGPETVQDFDKLDLQEILDNIRSRRNKIFLHMEEVCRFFVAVVNIIICLVKLYVTCLCKLDVYILPVRKGKYRRAGHSLRLKVWPPMELKWKSQN